MSYGWHWDDAISRQPLMRFDISYTLFLTPPEDYDGGELVVETPFGEQRYKRPAGGVVVYPTQALHRVEEVTRGMRQAAIGWVQSLVRDPAQRQILYDLEQVRRTLRSQSGKTREYDLMGKSISNLMRMWSDV
jgi:PKHD-type hydroxylase